MHCKCRPAASYYGVAAVVTMCISSPAPSNMHATVLVEPNTPKNNANIHHCQSYSVVYHRLTHNCRCACRRLMLSKQVPEYQENHWVRHFQSNQLCDHQTTTPITHGQSLGYQHSFSITTPITRLIHCKTVTATHLISMHDTYMQGQSPGDQHSFHHVMKAAGCQDASQH
jgi:hypothetical protein